MKKFFLTAVIGLLALLTWAQSFTGVTATGTDSYAITVSAGPYFVNQSFEVRFTNPNTGAATLIVTANGTVQAAKAITTDGTTPVTAGQLSGVVWLSYNGTNFQLTKSLGSLTNTAATNELPKANSSSNLVPSGLFNSTLGNLDLGTGLAGTDRTIAATGSATDVGIKINPKGAAGVHLQNDLFQFGSVAGSATLLVNGTGDFTVFGPDGPSSNGHSIYLKAGDGGTGGGNFNGGSTYLSGGLGSGTGVTGNVGFGTSVGSFGGGSKVVFVANAAVNPSTNPSGGFILYGDAGNASHPTIKLPSGTTIDLSLGGITNTAANNEIPKSNAVNVVPSGLYSLTSGNLDLGSTSIAGDRTISAKSSSANNALLLSTTDGSSVITPTLSLSQSGTNILYGNLTGENIFYVSNTNTGVSARATLAVQAGSAITYLTSYNQNNLTNPNFFNVNNPSGHIGFSTPTGSFVGINSGGSPARELHVTFSDATTNSIGYVQRLTKGSSGTAAIGIGSGIELEAKNASGTNRVGATIENPFSNVTNTTERADLVFKLISAGTLTERLRVTDAGAIGLSGANYGTAGQTIVSGGPGAAVTWGAGGGGTVSTVSVVTANGLAGTVANPTTTPAITLSTTINGLVKGNGTAFSAASAGTDYQAPIGVGANNTFLQSNGTATQWADQATYARNSFAIIPQNSTLNWYGDSYTLGTGATNVFRDFFNLVSNNLMSTASNNYAVSGTGWLRAARQSYTNVSVLNTNPSLIMVGFNDLRRNGNSTTCNPKTLEKIKSAERAIIANSWLLSAVAANNGSVTTGGTWSTTSGIHDKASLNLSGLVRTSTANGATLTYTWSGVSLVIGTFSTDEVITTGGDFTYAIDGGTPITYTGKNKTDGISDATYDNSICPNAIIITGLANTSHTVVITTVSTATVRIDYFGILFDLRFVPPIIISAIPKQRTSGYATIGGGSDNFGSDAVFNAGDAAILSVINEFPTGVPLYFNDVNDRLYNPYNDVSVDDIHPKDLGHYHLFQSIMRMVKLNHSIMTSYQNYQTDNSGYIGNFGDYLQFAANRNPVSGTTYNTGKAQSQISLLGASGDGSIHFYTSSANNTTPAETMTIEKGGSVMMGYSTLIGAESLGVQKNQNAATSIYLTNSTSGTAGMSQMLVSNSATAVNATALRSLSAGYTTSGMSVANTGILLSSALAGMGIFTQIAQPLTLGTNNAERARFLGTGEFGLGVTSPTATLHIKAGSATANTAPLQLTAGPRETVTRAGIFQYDTDASGDNLLTFAPTSTAAKVVALYNVTRATGQTAANASVATWTVGANDGTFMVSANILVTTSTTHSFTATCTYTDEGNTSRTATLHYSKLDGTVVTSIDNAAGAVPYNGVALQIRCKAATTITIATTGTFTTVTYNIGGSISQIN